MFQQYLDTWSPPFQRESYKYYHRKLWRHQKACLKPQTFLSLKAKVVSLFNQNFQLVWSDVICKISKCQVSFWLKLKLLKTQWWNRQAGWGLWSHCNVSVVFRRHYEVGGSLAPTSVIGLCFSTHLFGYLMKSVSTATGHNETSVQ